MSDTAMGLRADSPPDLSRKKDPLLATRLVSKTSSPARKSGAFKASRPKKKPAHGKLDPLSPGGNNGRAVGRSSRRRGNEVPRTRSTAVEPLDVVPGPLPPLDSSLGAGTTLTTRAGTPPSSPDKTSLEYMQSLTLVELCHHMQKHGEEIGFVYLKRAHPRSSVHDHAYNLRVVPHSETDSSEYYTMSGGGVTHVHGSRSDFTELDRWEKEYRIFNRIRQMPMLGNFRLWKGFATWRKNIIDSKRHDCREALEANLFLLHHQLRPALLRVQQLCLDIVEMQLCQIDPATSYDLDGFVEKQKLQVQKVSMSLGGFRENVSATVLAACKQAIQEAGFEDDGPKLTYTQQAVKRALCHRLSAFVRVVDMLVANAMQSLTVESVTLLHTSLAALHRKSFVPDDELKAFEEAQEQARVEAAKQAKKAAIQEDKKKDSVKETDDKVTTEETQPVTLLDVLNVSESKIAVRPHREQVSKPKKIGSLSLGAEEPIEPQPLLKVEMELSVAEISVSPKLDDTIRAFQSLVELFKTCVIGVDPLLLDESFYTVTRPTINNKQEEPAATEGTNLEAVFAEDHSLQEKIIDIDQVLRDAFLSVEEYGRQFEHFRTMLQENEKLDMEKLETEAQTPEYFRDSLESFKRMMREGKGIPPRVQIGLCLVSSEAFKETLLPSPTRCVEIIEAVLPKKAADLNAEILKRMDDTVFKLEASPSKTEEYVHTLTFLQNIPAVMTQMEVDVKKVTDMYELIHQFEIQAKPQDLAEHQTLRSAIIRVRDAVKAAVEDQPNKLEAFCTVLDKDISTLGAEVLEVRTDSQSDLIVDPNASVEEVLAYTKSLNDRMETLQGRAAMYKSYQKEFKVEVTKFNALEETHSEVRAKNNLWQTIKDWDEATKAWGEANFLSLNADEMNTQVTRFTKTIYTLGKSLPPNEVIPMVQVKIEKIRDKMGPISDLRNPALKPRHWEKLDAIIGQHIEHDDSFTLNLLDELEVWKHADEIQEVCGGASSEAALETMLKKVEDNWKETEFPCVPYRESKDVFILGGLDDVQVLLDDSQVNVSTIAGSRHVGPIKQRVEDIQKQLNLFSETLEEWLTCQRSWLYLESIFSAPDIQRQLPTEAKMFLEVDKSFKEAMRKTASFPNALRAGCTPGFLEMFKNNNSLLDQIQKCLEDYLESKRMLFPRFFFLSNDELLEILSQTRNPQAVQPHMRKCFDGIQKLQFGGTTEKPTNDILAIVSPEGEVVSLGKGIKARGNVELWLGSVEDAMMKSLHGLTKASLLDYMERPRTEWVKDHASQVVIAVSQMMWCKSATEALQAENPLEALVEFETKCKTQLADLAGISRQTIPKLFRKVLGALITIDVHARDIITGMIEAKCSSPTEFEWIKQLRYYWEEDIDDLAVYMSNSRYVYAYEYLGASMRLVITPLTDRCYLCLMGALKVDLGGAPAGPAGTGKTETTKDMAKALGTQCVVFNCSEGLDFRMMGKFFSGLAQSGAWCCFDEFNRIDIEVLSVIAQQILTIRNAKLAKQNRFIFEGREIRLIPKCAVFITMNPGYAGRTELPDNLKALFRPFAMMVPDYGLIAEVILFSEGFEDPKNLARKMVQMYKLCSEQLSQQDHYDFGMRAVKSVLVMAGSLKRERVGQSEATVLLTALRDSNLPKFLSEDAVLFQAILSDLFPGVLLPEHDYGKLQSAIEASLGEKKLQVTEKQVKKVIQLYETMVVRHGVMLVGPTGGGKTTAYQVLQTALSNLHAEGVEHQDYLPVHTYVLNPKAVSMGELYGEVNPATTEWHDGLMATTVRHCVADQTTDHKWIVCDGPVDALWIENMNTVLDDNKMLCLANSERIKLTPSMHMLFEVQDLAVASPATVSRCGMVYVDPSDLGWRPFVGTWLAQLPSASAELKEYILELFDLLPPLLYQTRKTLTETMQQVDQAKVASLCYLFQELLTGKGNKVDWEQEDSSLRCVAAVIFFFSTVWSVGGNLVDRDADAFDALVRDTFESVKEVRIPGAGSVQDYFIDFEQSPPGLKNWESIVPAFRYNSEVPFFDMLVPTVSTVKFSYLLEKFLLCEKSVLFTGTTGVGKSVIVADLITRAEGEHGIVPITINFSAQTSSKRTQEIIESKLEKKRKSILGAPAGKKLVFFVDDLNMPKLEEYGAQPPIELLRQYQDFRGFYDRDKLFWKDIEDVTLTAACAPPGGGRNPTTPRFLRHFAMLSLPTPDNKSLLTIFSQILKGFLGDGFSKPVQQAAKGIVSAAVEIYERMRTDLLPTPAKSHYVFNLRDLSKCIQGVMQADTSVIKESDHVIELFYHECMRVFHDRLINQEDKTYFHQILAEMSNKHLNKSVDPEKFDKDPVIFGDFMKIGASGPDRVYEQIDKTKVEKILEEYLDDYNLSSSKEMKLVFFQDAIQHVSRIARMVRQPRGNALLVGVGGCGKQSLTRMACHMAGYKCIQIEITRGYGYNEFREDLKLLYESAGTKGEDTVFLFTDTQIVVEEFLEDINNMLNSGEVPNLIESDEIERFLGPVRPLAKAAGYPETRDGVYQYFISRVRDKLHIVLCMSPVGDAFRARCRMFPSIVNCCTIDWFTEWPREALLSVSKRFFEFVDLGSDDLKEKISEMCVEIHTSVSGMADRFYDELRRKYYTTPTSYLELINLYTSMLDEKKRALVLQRDRFQTGLNKLLETNDLVANMQKELTALEPVLKEKSADTAKLMEKVKVDQAEADKVRTVVQQEEAVAKKEAAETEAIKADAQRDLDQALPALDAANKALDALDKKDVQEVKVFAKPPELVQTVLEAVCVLFGRATDWKTAKGLLGEPDFIKNMKSYDKDNVTEKTLRKLKPYIDNPLFNAESVAKVSKACTSMCLWVGAVDLYAKVFKTVQPKREKLEAAQTALQNTMAQLKEKQDRLKGVEKKIKKLKKQFDDSVKAKKDLEDNMQTTAARLERAGKLQSALGSEQVRWGETVKNYDVQINDVVGNVFLAAACVAYFGAFTAQYRKELVDSWVQQCQALGIPVSEGVQIADVLSNPYQIREWNSCGLPRDMLSTENAVLVTCGRRWPLMIDPQDQANVWIRKMEGKNGLKVIKLTEPNFLRTLENAIRIGQPVLLEEVGETLDPSLEPILLKQTFKQGGRLLIRLGDSDIDYDKNFRFYMTTKMANPHYLPEICIKVTIINFTVTKTGLEDQLLSDVVRLERPDLEEKRTKLILGINEDKAQLKGIEDKILKLLFQSEGNILDDEVLIETLNNSKKTSAVIGTRLEQAEKTEASITEAREKYRPVALRGSILFFVIADLGSVDPMYQYSLAYFKQLFNFCIEEAEKNKDLEKRLVNIINHSTVNVYTNIARGLFEKHKLVFSFMLCAEIMRQRGDIADDEWNFFLRGAGAGERKRPDMPDLPFMKQNIWNAVCDLESTLPVEFEGITDDFQAAPVKCSIGSMEFTLNSDGWEGQADAPKGNWQESLSMFQRLVALKVVAEERVTDGVVQFVSENLGKTFVESPAVELPTLYKDMTPSVPLIFILSVGSDPMTAFLRFARERGYSERVHAISLGQGQGPVAERLIANAKRSGDWVFLQNCHLAKSWMNSMEVIIKQLADPDEIVHDDFRLFLSSAPCTFFPVTVLQNSVKVTNEPPKGLRANIRRAFAEVTPKSFEEHDLGVNWRKLVFGICFFHAIIQERKKFGPLGWNIKYEFSNSDRECALENLKIFVEDGSIPWDALFFITGEITYGGRVTDSWDQRCLRTILSRFFKPSCLEEGYVYSDSGTYAPKGFNKLSEYVEYVETFPFTDNPEIFGMHENANIAFQREETGLLLRTILDVQPRLSSSKGGKTPDEIVYELAEMIQDKLPKRKFDLDEAKEGLFTKDDKGQVDSLSTVLRQESDRFNNLLQVLWDSLENIKKAIRGLVVMSAELEKVYTSFINNQVPELWANAAYPSLKPLGSWVKDLVLRLAFIQSWLTHDAPPSFWLSGFFFPQGFLTGTLQNHARKYNLPIDTLSFEFTVLDTYISQSDGIDSGKLPKVKDGVLVHGLFMDAFRWDDEQKVIADSRVGVMHSSLPAMHMCPKQNFTPQPEDYIAPLYKTSQRFGMLSTTGHSTNFVVSVHLPADKPQEYWISKGAALLCQLDE